MSGHSIQILRVPLDCPSFSRPAIDRLLPRSLDARGPGTPGTGARISDGLRTVLGAEGNPGLSNREISDQEIGDNGLEMSPFRIPVHLPLSNSRTDNTAATIQEGPRISVLSTPAASATGFYHSNISFSVPWTCPQVSGSMAVRDNSSVVPPHGNPAEACRGAVAVQTELQAGATRFPLITNRRTA